MSGSVRPLGGSSSAARLLLTLTTIELTLATAYIHFSLGGQLFTLNGIGYLALAGAFGFAAAADRLPFVNRFGWLPRVGLAAFTLVTIVAYLVIGPYFALGWITKGIEVAIVALVAIDLLDAYGSWSGFVRAVSESFGVNRRRRPAEQIQVE